MVNLKKLKISKIQKRLKMDFLKNPFLLVIGILLIIIIILIIYNYFNKKSKNIESFYNNWSFRYDKKHCKKFDDNTTDDEKAKCCDMFFNDIDNDDKSQCVSIEPKKFCTTENLKKFESFKDACLENGISSPIATTTAAPIKTTSASTTKK